MVIVASLFATVNTLRYGNGMDKKLNRQGWLTAGLQALAESGPDGLKIMPIAGQLRVTKGSFYWHFENLDAYRQAVLAEWERHYTGDAIRSLEDHPLDARTKLHTWIVGAAHADLRLERAIRAWSLHHPETGVVRQRVDTERIGYLCKLLRGVGWPDEEADTLARWAYGAWVGYATLDGPGFTDRQLGLIVERLLPI
jgi:AcrR family transcriptional regulator